MGDIPYELSSSDGGDGESADDGIVLFPARVALWLYMYKNNKSGFYCILWGYWVIEHLI